MDMGNEVFINSPERIHRRDLVGQLAQSLMAKSYRIGGQGRWIYRRDAPIPPSCSHNPEVAPGV